MFFKKIIIIKKTYNINKVNLYKFFILLININKL